MPATVEPHYPRSNGFHENMSKYRCCFGRLHSRQGLSIFAKLELIIFGIAVGFSVYGTIGFHQSVQQTFITSIFINFCYIASIFASLYAIKAQQSHFLIPYAVLQAVCIVGSIVGFNFSLIQISMLTSVVIENHEDHDAESGNKSYSVNYNWSYSMYRTDIGLCRGLVAVFAIFGYLVLKICILVTVTKCYAYLKDKQDRRIINRSTMEISVQQSTVELDPSGTVLPCPVNQPNRPPESPFELIQPRSPSESVTGKSMPHYHTFGYAARGASFHYVKETA